MSGKQSSKEEIETFLLATHSDTYREKTLGTCQKIVPESLPTIQINVSETTWSEVQEVVKRARSGSAPGPNGIPYRVYKYCPKLLRRLWKMLKVVWRKGKVPESWKKADGIFAAKENGAKETSQFRTISLLNVEWKIFFSVLSRRLTTYMLANQYVDTAIQKGWIPGFSVCVEHTSAITQLIREAKVSKGDITIIWLDLANAYGSIPHQLIMKALDHYHISEHVKELIKCYYNGISLSFTTEEISTGAIPLEKDIVTVNE